VLAALGSGRSEGVAKVVFINPADAKVAFERYNNVALDHQPMKITIHRGRPQDTGRTLSSGIRYTLALTHAATKAPHGLSCWLFQGGLVRQGRQAVFAGIVSIFIELLVLSL
jgi:hypothetical protein